MSFNFSGLNSIAAPPKFSSKRCIFVVPGIGYLIAPVIRILWPDPIELSNANHAFDNFSNILLQFVRIPNEIELKTSKQEAFSSILSISLLYFNKQFLVLPKQPRPQ